MAERRKLFVYECEFCFALIPYQGANHNCPEDNHDEGFEDDVEMLETFFRQLRQAKRDPNCDVIYLYTSSS